MKKTDTHGKATTKVWQAGHMIYHHMLFRKYSSRNITKNACRGSIPEPLKSSAPASDF